MWDLEYIQRFSGADKVEQVDPEHVACTPPGGGHPVLVRARKVTGGWVIEANGDTLCNPEPVIARAVEMVNWRRIFPRKP